MMDNILQEIQKEIKTSNELNEVIKEFKDVVENFINNLEYFEEMYKMGENSAKTVEFLKNFSEHVNAVNVEYKQLMEAQTASRQAEKNHLTQLSQTLERSIDKQFAKFEKAMQNKIELELKNMHKSMKKSFSAITTQIEEINISVESLEEENENIVTLIEAMNLTFFPPEISENEDEYKSIPKIPSLAWNEFEFDDEFDDLDDDFDDDDLPL